MISTFSTTSFGTPTRAPETFRRWQERRYLDKPCRDASAHWWQKVNSFAWDKETYTRGLLAYYELGNSRILAKAYTDAYPSSADAYHVNTVHRPKSSEQMAAEIRYQEFARARLRDIVLGRMERNEPLPDSIPTQDRKVVEEMLRTQLDSLHPGRAAPLGVTSADIEAYLKDKG